MQELGIGAGVDLMDSQANTTNTTDLYRAFDQNVNLFTLIGNDAAVAMLKIVADHILNENSERKRTAYPVILIHGSAPGKRTLVRAFSNSIQFTFREIMAEHLGMQFGPESFFEDSSNTLCFLNNIVPLHGNIADILYAILTERKVIASRQWADNPEAKPFEGILVMSASDLDEVPDCVIKNVSVFCKTVAYKTPTLVKILKQRRDLLKWKCSDTILETLIFDDDITKALRRFELAYRIMRAEGTEEIVFEQAARAVQLLEANT
jgi:hypothetical protein